MFYVLVGLGNPGVEYKNTRHNTGRFMLESFATANNFPEWVFNKNVKSLVSAGKIGKQSLSLILPETFMNKSGDALRRIKDLRFKISAKGGSALGGNDKKREIKNLAVIHDDLDIPFGKFKISFNKRSGGHRGVESIIKAVKTEAFVRVRVGICPVTLSGKLKKLHGEEAVEKHILGKFSPDQLVTLNKLSKRVSEALAVLVTDGREKAMSQQSSL